jgi:hypothetical protein
VVGQIFDLVTFDECCNAIGLQGGAKFSWENFGLGFFWRMLIMIVFSGGGKFCHLMFWRYVVLVDITRWRKY